jgi:O-antigen/teichoic acid export membrane protein
MTTDRLRVNVIANLAGRGWTMVFGIAVIPLYAYYLGIEAFGLIGLAASLQAIFSLLDFGTGAALSRELARLSGEPSGARDQANTLKTFEIVYWCICLLMGACSIGLSAYIARNWVNPVFLTTKMVTRCVQLISLSIVCQTLMGFYQGGLMGLQRQVSANSTTVIVTTARGIGSVLLLAFVSTRIDVFLLWQIIPVAFGALFSRIHVWKALDYGVNCRFEWRLLRRTWKYAAGWGSNSLILALFAQADKLLLGRILTLETLGYYTLAQTLASPVPAITGSLGASIFPRFTQLATQGRLVELARLYHKASQYLVLLVVPLVVVISAFSSDILFMWTRNVSVAENGEQVLRFLILGTMFSSLITIPNYIQLAHGYFRLTIGSLLILGSAYLPILAVMVNTYKSQGAALTWLVVNFCFLLSVPLMHRHFLKGEFKEWILKDTVAPLLLSFACGVVMRLIYPSSASAYVRSVFLAFSYCAVLATVILSLKHVQSAIRDLFAARFRLLGSS